jgi:predicted sugar kinase
MTQIELTTPACLLLGMVPVGDQLGQLGITLQFPPLQLEARDSATLSITGGRADLAARQAMDFFRAHGLAPRGEIEIELAVPQFMGLGSAGMLGLSVAQALASLHGLPAGDLPALAGAIGLSGDEALEVQAFAQGGLLLVDSAGTLRERREIAHADEAEDWIFVLVLPRVPAGTPDTFEAEQRQALRSAARQLGPEAGRIAEAELWPAVDRDDFAAFAQALASIRAANDDALARAGAAPALSGDEQAILEIMREGGALAYGRTLTGLGLYGLIKGGGPSRELRRALSTRLGYFAGTVMASISDNAGARLMG